MRRLHINRARNCLNPDCRSIFSPVNPHANCCCEICRNRLNYLYRKAFKNGIPKENSELKYIYAVCHSFFDRRKYEVSEVELGNSGVNFQELLKTGKTDQEGNIYTFKLGDIELRINDNKTFQILKK